MTGGGAQQMVSKISVEGGAVVPLAEAGISAGASWADNGVILASPALEGALRTIPEDGGDATPLFSLGRGETFFLRPQFLPGGETILFASHTRLSDGGASANVEVFSLRDQTRTILVRGATSPAYLPSGHLVYNRGGTLFATPFDPKAPGVPGSGEPVLFDLAFDPDTGGASYAFSLDGTFVYRTGGASTSAGDLVRLEWLDGDGNRAPLISMPDDYQEVRLSPDGDRVALISGAGGRVSIYNPGRGTFTRVTFDDGLYSRLAWTPDAGNLFFSLIGVGILEARVDGSGPPEVLFEAAARPYSFAPDLRLAYDELGAGGTDIRTVRVTNDGRQSTSAAPEDFLATPFGETFPMFSPDGRWLAYQSDESGRNEVSVRPFPAPTSGDGAKIGISNGGGGPPVWSPDTQELFYQAPSGAIIAVDWRVEADRFIADRPRVWSEEPGGEFRDMGSSGRAVIAVPVDAGDGAPDEAEPEHHVVFLQNFFDYLRREVPIP